MKKSIKLSPDIIMCFLVSRFCSQNEEILVVYCFWLKDDPGHSLKNKIVWIVAILYSIFGIDETLLSVLYQCYYHTTMRFIYFAVCYGEEMAQICDLSRKNLNSMLYSTGLCYLENIKFKFILDVILLSKKNLPLQIYVKNRQKNRKIVLYAIYVYAIWKMKKKTF